MSADDYAPEEIQARFDATLRRMLATPPIYQSNIRKRRKLTPLLPTVAPRVWRKTSVELKSDQPGYWEFLHHPEAGSYMHFRCPCGCKYQGAVAVRRADEPKHWEVDWIWDGNEQRPTLSPSLRRGTPCKFHGFLKHGAWEACADGAPLAPNVYCGQAP